MKRWKLLLVYVRELEGQVKFTVIEALESESGTQWRYAMQTKHVALMENGTWELVELPQGKNVIGSRWVFTTKYNADGKIKKNKGHLVAQDSGRRRFEDFILSQIGFIRKTDSCLYTMFRGGEINIITTYVDDILMTCPLESTMRDSVKKLCAQVEAGDRGQIKLYLRMEIERDGIRGNVRKSKAGTTPSAGDLNKFVGSRKYRYIPRGEGNFIPSMFIEFEWR
ncbi:uncharacterized protein LOC110118521 isoform X2 [Ceratitis capitata]|uniref:uncharacterized protein LOC110118521 isoform X2 n=1 Tax=Ceratitis capitata TaxID=7213 RepID=UPI000A1199AB|nr:uncharacterized protein LOC110118521 isoform X2 [Ceratitis capitata]